MLVGIATEGRHFSDTLFVDYLQAEWFTCEFQRHYQNALQGEGRQGLHCKDITMRLMRRSQAVRGHFRTKLTVTFPDFSESSLKLCQYQSLLARREQGRLDSEDNDIGDYLVLVEISSWAPLGRTDKETQTLLSL
eukprot:gnl/TRDRNA2_/TRDRNA2_173700_c0_seq7.p1 gnl/TRDRNA2_/TRDRNA2_173700_c0~~gnl/TRDRNA2_/TRDRNA2_173700_c0_seq7.p1  ORF type:complete len:135 (+),score=13.65 gnl/TRDRNA2_/TRDRNA2_173700_c0_seq7:357-761(+)